jgi:DNA modification methylase
VAALVAVFREVRRVLKPTGSLFLNLGDTFASAWACSRRNQIGNGSLPDGSRRNRPNRLEGGLKEKDLIGVPWAVAFALRDDGWYLRAEIIWAKANAMPESVEDRPTRAHEHIFLLTRQARYFYDSVAVRQPNVSEAQAEHNARYAREYAAHTEHSVNGQPGNVNNVGIHSRPGPGGANLRSVWNLSTQPSGLPHYAMMAYTVVERCIKAGSSERGCCPACGAPHKRVVERTPSVARLAGNDWQVGRELAAHHGPSRPGSFVDGSIETTGWTPTCKCPATELVPSVVLDPFAGAGTTLLVANRLGRDALGVELSGEYAHLAAERVRGDQPLFNVVEFG